MIGAYFSKPDWHCNDYWSRDRATPTRNVNYDIKLNPDKWKRFQEYTANQINELMTRYGRVDLLWLDGGWVRAPKEDIKMDQIIDKAREYQPGLIAVDRTVPGRNENYQTPELTIPKRQLDHPLGKLHHTDQSLGMVERRSLQVGSSSNQYSHGDCSQKAVLWFWAWDLHRKVLSMKREYSV